MPPKSKAAAAEPPASTADVDIAQAVLAAEFKPIDTLIAYARNARTHSDAQVDQIAASIVEFGFTNPVLADDKGIVAGHGRVMGARKVYASGQVIKLPNGVAIPPGTVPVLNCAGWSEAKRKAYVLADNQLALNAGWDKELLALEFADLAALDFNFDVMGFDKAFVDEINGKRVHFGDPDEDAPEPPAAPCSRLGDIWVLGDHRIICGDATDAETVKAMLAGDTPNLMVTDPPYGVDYDPEWRLRAGVNKPHQKRAEGVVENDDRADWREAWALFDGDVAYVWHGALHSPLVAESLISSGFAVRSQIIWAKASLVMGRGDYHWQHEPCWYVVRKGGKGNWQGDRKQSTLWQIANMHATQGKVDDGKTNHSTQKPVECMRRPIENNSKAGDLIYEPFSGSGTTIIACEMTGRLARAVELSPAYVDVAVTRWEAFTKQAAILEGDGRTFAEVMAERCPPGTVQVTVAEPPKPKRAKPPAKAKAATGPSA
jgi:DNA modification methylase